MRYYYVYILTNKNRNVLYTGVTNNITRRMWEHKNHFYKGFTDKYNVVHLIYYEIFNDISYAKQRERAIKRWKREFKFNLIKSMNPELIDLAEEWF